MNTRITRMYADLRGPRTQAIVGAAMRRCLQSGRKTVEQNLLLRLARSSLKFKRFVISNLRKSAQSADPVRGFLEAVR